MARQTIVQLVDDLDGSAADETVTFALDGASYEIDLSNANVAILRAALSGYVAKATRIRSGRSTKAGTSQRGETTIAGQVARQQRGQIRAWVADLLGTEGLPARGRIATEVVAAFRAGDVVALKAYATARYGWQPAGPKRPAKPLVAKSSSAPVSEPDPTGKRATAGKRAGAPTNKAPAAAFSHKEPAPDTRSAKARKKAAT
jgi:hypothetical protein